ncbi:MAG: plasmid recombination protein [Oscillospiraceae bacterium]|nr:plasmid recombination protein [Oscillospiraceae bacterium]
MTVVRNNPHSRNSVGAVERHNERKNETYSNVDVVVEQSHNNIYFKKCENTYLQIFDKMIADNVISTRGLKPDAHIMGEMIFDVNTRYFEENGGYEFARKFYEDAYKFAVDLVGDERYIISSVMHADERNKALTDELEKDVFHYHLHIVYVPVVEKEIRWSKRCKTPELIGTVKEVINQVSHSKKWQSTLENGVMTKSYSKLQDDFWEHMRSAGYEVERGEKGSTKEHLTVIEYKTEQETQRLAEVTQQVMQQMFMQQKLDEEIVLKESVIKQKEQLDKLGKKTLIGNEIKLTAKEFEEVKNLALIGIDSQIEIKELKSEIKMVKSNYNALQKAYDILQLKYDDLKLEFARLKRKVQPYIDALKHSPEKVRAVIQEVLNLIKQDKQKKKNRYKQK